MPKLLDILKTVGAGIIREVVPGGGLLVEAVNAVLPAGKKLSAGATGPDISAAVASLPADQRANIMSKEFDVDLTWIKEGNETLRTMLKHDAENPHSTRPAIALGAFRVVAFVCVSVVSVWAIAVLTGKDEMVEAVTGGWPFVAAVIAPLVTLLWAYFGVLKQEHKNKLNAAGGASHAGGIVGILSSLINRKN